MERYRGLSASEFFYRNREIAGFSNPARALYQTVRELVENSLDATETHGILPEIRVSIELGEDDRVVLCVEDNGVGIPGDKVPSVFGRMLYGSKYVLRQARGVFGLGVKMAVLYAQLTTGKPVHVVTSTRTSRFVYEYLLQIDIERNIPVILDMKVRRKEDGWHGTIVRLTTKGNWQAAHRRIEDYIRRTAMIAPYATIVYSSPDGVLTFERTSTKLPEPPQIGKHHPRGVDIELLKMMIRKAGDATLLEFLTKHFDGVGRITAQKFCEWAGFDPDAKVRSLSIDDLERLASSMREFPKWRRPRPTTLSPLGEELLENGVRKILKPEFVAAVTRPPSSYGGNPFIIEVAVAYGGEIPDSGSPILYRFANRIPLLYDEGVDVSRKVVDSIDWSVYKVRFPAPLAVVTHVCSTKIPFKGVGKEAVADVPEVERELNIAIREAARKLRGYLTKLEKLYELKRREVTIGRYIEEVARALGYIVGEDTSLFEERLREMLKRDIEGRASARGEVGAEEECVASVG